LKRQSHNGSEKIHALGFGLFLGLCVWKFGDPVILEQKISRPVTWLDFWGDAWPPHWATWILVPLVLLGMWLSFQKATGCRLKLSSKWLWQLPLIWLGWQFVSATGSVDPVLTKGTLWQFGGCVASYFLGLLLFAREKLVHWLLVGILAAFVFCLVRGVNQRLFEFPASLQSLEEGERSGWTNFPPSTIA